MSTGSLDDIVGAFVVAAWRKDGDLFLVTDRGVFRLYPEGECCASCFIQHVGDSHALAEATVREVEEVAHVRERDNVCDVVDVWAHRIHTTKGICTIDMRVEHNGYYGGSLHVQEHDGPVPAGAIPLEDF